MRTTRILFFAALAFLFLASAVAVSAQTPLQFIAVTPCRLVDTRNTGGPIQGDTSRDFTVQGNCGIPSSAAAYSLNVTAVPHGTLGFLTVWPAGQTRPGNYSTLNSYDGRFKANAAIVVAGTNGAVSVYVSNTSDVVLDIDGYFVPATSSSLSFYPLEPCRIADTRNAVGDLGGPFLQGQMQRDFPVLEATSCNIPATAQAYSLNFTVVPRGGPVWVFNAWPAGGPQPTTSTLNAPTGTVVANAALVPAGANGDIDVWVSDDTDLVIDIDGYFAPPGPGGIALYNLAPCRILDTRNAGGLFSGVLPVDVLGSSCNIPASAQAYVFNATVVPAGTLGLLALFPDGQPPQTQFSTLNAWDGAVTSNMAIVPSSPQNGKIDANASDPTQLILDISSYLAPLPGLAITTTSLPDGMTGQAYQAQLTATGGEPPYSWSITSGTLPPGLTLSAGGAISGTPTLGGTFPFTVQVIDTLSNTATANLSIVVTAGGLVITPTSLPDGIVSVAYNATLGAAGGFPPYTWTIASGTLPAGLTLNASSGLISGTPTAVGPSPFTVQVQDSQQDAVQANLQIVIDPAITNGALRGNYVISFNGYNHGNPILIGGSFLADGNGNITSGVLDLNDGNGSRQAGYSFTGNYTITADGVGTVVFNAGGSLGTLNFHAAIANGGNGTLIQDNVDPNSRGSGAFYKQTAADFSVLPPGNYAIGTFGADQNFARYAKGGIFQVGSNGAVTGGTEDVNDNGNLTSRTFAGHFLPPSPISGRGQATLSFPNGVTNNYAYYIVFNGQIILIGTDPLSSVDPLTLGSILVQPSGGFDNSSLMGVSVIEVNGVAPNNGNPQADASLGLLTADGNGNITATVDENKGGTVTQQQIFQGTYSVATNGRVTTAGLGANPPILYLSSPNQAFVLGQDNAVTSGIVEPQTALPPFSNLSIFGTYLGGTVTPVLSPLVDSVSWILADGNGNLNGIENTSGPSGPGTQNLAATYQVDSTGRAVVTGTPVGIMYVVSGTKIVLLPTDNNPVLNTFASGATH